jgi:hypothetical protein
MDINPGLVLSISLASVPTMLTVLIGILINNSRLSDLRSDFSARLNDLRSHMDTRFDDMRMVLDAPLKHLEER